MGTKENENSFKNKEENPAPVDGYWLTLQTWSQCNKKCDGGVSTFHRMCIPPKNAGKPCIGEPVITKECNMEPCPNYESDSINPFNPLNFKGNNNPNVKIMEPIVKVLPFTDSPQRYTLCKIKESDLMIYEDGKDKNKINDPLFKGKKIEEIGGLKIPCRVVMNSNTLTVFSGEKFETLYLSFTLKKTRFYKAENKKYCFKLYETSTKYITLCPFTSEDNSNEFDTWRKDFDTFKTKCDRPLKNTLSKEEQKALDEKIKEKMVYINPFF